MNEATVAQDGFVEAFLSVDKVSMGIMWHPERESPFIKEDIELMRDFVESNL